MTRPQPPSLILHFAKSAWEGAGCALGCFGILILFALTLSIGVVIAAAVAIF